MRLKDALGGNLGDPAGKMLPCQVSLLLERTIVTRARPGVPWVSILKSPRLSTILHLEEQQGFGALSRREPQNCLFSIESDFKETRSTSVSAE
jgi:hypothetical protein